MLCGVSPTSMKRAASCFKRGRVAFGSLREFHSGLMLDNVEDLVDWEVQGVKVMEPSTFAVTGERAPWELGLGAPLRAFSSCRAEGSHGHHVGRPLWIAYC